MTRSLRRAHDEHGNEIPPMTIAWMQEHDTRSVYAICEALGCGHVATVNLHNLPDDLPVPEITLKLRCSRCRGRSTQTRPNWTETKAAPMGAGRLCNPLEGR